ncbi:MAG: HI0074 family nucleotidyltransferase substrate-binding subunit [Bdellovibrionales bacterium]
MEESKLKYSLSLFESANHRLLEALEVEVRGENDLAIDGSIQRFEFTFEMSWKTLKRFLSHKGIEAKTPRDCFQEAFKLGWLAEGDTLWTAMIDDRNRTSHTYDRKIAQNVYGSLVPYARAYSALIDRLGKEI